MQLDDPVAARRAVSAEAYLDRIIILLRAVITETIVFRTDQPGPWADDGRRREELCCVFRCVTTRESHMLIFRTQTAGHKPLTARDTNLFLTLTLHSSGHESITATSGDTN